MVRGTGSDHFVWGDKPVEKNLKDRIVRRRKLISGARECWRSKLFRLLKRRRETKEEKPSWAILLRRSQNATIAAFRTKTAHQKNSPGGGKRGSKDVDSTWGETKHKRRKKRENENDGRYGEDVRLRGMRAG